MKNIEAWAPTKFVPTSRGWRASRDVRQVGLRSRLIVDLIAVCYEAALRTYAAGRLVDVGCGRVPLYGIYGPLVREATCVDWAQSFHITPHLDSEVDLNRPLPLASAAYDTVLATDVLEHLRHPGAFVHEVARILAPGGHAIVGVPFFYWLHEEPHDYHRFTEHALRAMCTDAGLEVVSLAPYGGPIAVLADILGKNLSTAWRARVVDAVARAVLRTSVGARRDAAGARLSPLGYCLVARRPATEDPA